MPKIACLTLMLLFWAGLALAALSASTSYQITAQTGAATGGITTSGSYINQGVLGQGGALGVSAGTVTRNLAGFLYAAHATLDADHDLLANLFDNCWHVANTPQENFDLDPWGNACDPDDDNDLLADAWELRYGLNPFDSYDSGLDSDSDGMTNLAEYLAGSDPTRVGALPPDYRLPAFITPLLLAPEDGPVDGQRPLPR